MSLKKLRVIIFFHCPFPSIMFTCYVKVFAVQNIFIHTQHIALYLYFTWQLISAITVGRHQASIQEHKNIEQLYVQ